MKELKGTKTEKNLMEAFAGESMDFRRDRCERERARRVVVQIPERR